jgi:hypothetical protein
MHVNALLRWAEIVGWAGGGVRLVLTSVFLAVPRSRRSPASNKQVL